MATTRIQHVALVALSSLAALAFEPNAWAVTQTTGAGSAVSIVEGTANFESLSALSDNPYLEGGMVFSRTNLSNNPCDFAGCAGHPGFVGFSGNYMYGIGSGYFEIAATGGNVFHGLEFTIGTGFDINPQNVSWQAFSSSILVGSGTLSLSSGTIIGFSDAIGFDNLRYTSDDRDSYGYVAPAFDSVHAQFTAAVPEPEIYAMMMAGLGLLGYVTRRKKLQGAALLMR
jgi:PEP-CTERM motif